MQLFVALTFGFVRFSSPRLHTKLHCADVCNHVHLFVRDLIRKLLVHERTKRLGNMKVSIVSM